METWFWESQKSQRWWKRLLESGMGRKLISNGSWVLWDVTQPQGINLVGQHPNLVVHTSPNHQWHQGCADETKSVGVMKIIGLGTHRGSCCGRHWQVRLVLILPDVTDKAYSFLNP